MLTSLLPGEVLAPGGAVRRRAPRRPGLRSVVSTVWTTVVPADAGTLRVLPDAATELVFADGRLVVAGPDTVACREILPAGRPVIGFQLRPGAVAGALGVLASAVRDQRVDVRDLWGAEGRDLVDAMAEAGASGAAADRLEQFLVRRTAGFAPDRLPSEIMAQLRDGRRVDVDQLGVGERQVRRRCVASFGYGLRTLARIVRFQSTVELLSDRPAVPLSAAAAAVGYVDQAHLAHEVDTFSSLTPRALRAALSG